MTGKLRITVLLLLVLTLMSAATVYAGVSKYSVVTENGQIHIYNDKGKQIKNMPVCEVKAGGGNQYYQVDAEGAAKRFEGVEALAARQLCLLKAGNKKSDKNLKKAFTWCVNLGKATLKEKRGSSAAKYYGEFAFKKGKGDCHAMAYAFYWMAKVMGYDANYIQGYVGAGSVSNMRYEHRTWVTIRMGKSAYAFDPMFSQYYAKQFGKFCGYKFTYGKKNTYIYFIDKNKKKTKLEKKDLK